MLKNCWKIVFEMFDILSQIKPKIAGIINEDSYKTWIEPLRFIDYKDGKCLVSVPNTFFRDWITENFDPIIVALLKEITKEHVKMEYILKKKRLLMKRK